jgi:hypothetical protein
MAQKDMIYSGKVAQSGYWNYGEVYGMLYNWLKDSGYNVAESSYKEKLVGNGKEINIEWEAGKKVTDYFQYKITLSWQIIGMKDAEVEMDGKKVKTNKGDLAISFKAFLVKDYESRWEDKPMWKFLRGVYEQYVIRKTVDGYAGGLDEEISDMISDLKAFLRIPVG